MKDTRSEALKPLRDLIIVGNLMAQKIGDDPNNLANTWDEVVIRLRAAGILEKVAMMELRAEQKAEMASASALIDRAMLEILP